MGKAPNLDEMKKATKTPAKEKPVSEKKAPSMSKKKAPALLPFSVYGCGGAGRIAANRFAKRHGGESVVTIDTARGLTRTEKGVNAYHIDKLNGSGKVRDTNKDAIEAFVDEKISAGDFKDINIVICSASGGSGSVIAPRLVKNIMSHGKDAVLLCIADTISEIDCSNSIATMIEISNMVRSDLKKYLPAILFSNQYGREEVDNGIDVMTDRLVRILSKRYHGSDRRDRLHFLSPMRASKLVKPDMRLLNLSESPDGEWEEGYGMVYPTEVAEKLDSILTICKMGESIALGTKFKVLSDGYYDNDQETPIICSLGYASPTSFNQFLNKELRDYRSASTEEDTSFGFEDDDMYDDY